jgi:hypothetical protein
MNNKINGGKRMQSKSLSRKREMDPGENDLALKAGAGFPTARYFQIHFEYLQEQLHLTQGALQALQTQMHQLQQQLPVTANLQASDGSSKLQRQR